MTGGGGWEAAARTPAQRAACGGWSLHPPWGLRPDKVRLVPAHRAGGACQDSVVEQHKHTQCPHPPPTHQHPLRSPSLQACGWASTATRRCWCRRCAPCGGRWTSTQKWGWCTTSGYRCGVRGAGMRAGGWGWVGGQGGLHLSTAPDSAELGREQWRSAAGACSPWAGPAMAHSTGWGSLGLWWLNPSHHSHTTTPNA